MDGREPAMSRLTTSVEKPFLRKDRPITSMRLVGVCPKANGILPPETLEVSVRLGGSSEHRRRVLVKVETMADSPILDK